MYNLKNGKTMLLNSGVLTYSFSPDDVRVDHKIELFDLRSVFSFDVIDTTGNLSERTHAEFRRTRKSKPTTWLLASDLRDDALDDDSIIGGALLGANAGYLFTTENEVQTVKVAITFNDGRSLPLEVDTSELTILIGEIQGLTKNRKSTLTFPNERALTKDELSEVMDCKVTTNLRSCLMEIFTPLLMMALAYYAYMYFDNQYLENQKMTFHDMVLSYFFISIMVLSGLFSAVGFIDLFGLGSLSEHEKLGYEDEKEYAAAISLGLIKEPV